MTPTITPAQFAALAQLLMPLVETENGNDGLQPFDTCPTCEALARTVMMDQTGAA